MNRIDLILMGFKNLFRRKARTVLTTLGVVIGTVAIVTMLSLGFGMKASYQRQLEYMGSITTIDVYPSFEGGPYGVVSPGQAALDDSAIAQFREMSGVKAVTPVLDSYGKIVSGKYMADISIRGIIPETMADFDLEAAGGRLLSEGDESGVVFGSQTIHFFSDPRRRNNFDPWSGNQDEPPKVNVLTDKLQLTFDWSYGERRPPMEQGGSRTPPKLFKIKGVGILREKEQDCDYTAYMDIARLKKIMEENLKNQGDQGQGQRNSIKEQLKYQRAMVKVEDIKYVKGIRDEIKGLGFEAYSLTDVLESMEKQALAVQMILGGIGAISLLVAAIGITNTMIMSIYERTKEIGILKVIGASLKDIKGLFLFESGMIGFLGGLFGIVLSFGISLLLNFLAKRGGGGGIFGMGGPDTNISIIPLWLVFAVLGFSFLVGLVSGYYPAKRATKLSALEAIRNE